MGAVYLALGIVCLWLAAGCFYIASHQVEATSPWEAYQTIISKLRDS